MMDYEFKQLGPAVLTLERWTLEIVRLEGRPLRKWQSSNDESCRVARLREGLRGEVTSEERTLPEERRFGGQTLR